MEKINLNKKAKILLIGLMIISILISYVPGIVLADEETDEFVKFTAQYTGNVDTVSSGRNIGINYNFKLTGIQTGFQDVMLTVKDEDLSSAAATITAKIGENGLNENTSISNNGRYTTINFGNVRTGNDFSGVVNVNFAKNPTYETYQKEITLVFTGKYNHPQNGTIDFTKEVKLNTNVQTAADQIPFKAEITSSFERKRDTEITYKTLTNYNNFDVNVIKQVYLIKLSDANATYSKIVLSTSRSIADEEQIEDLGATISPSEINLEENLIISTAYTNFSDYGENFEDLIGYTKNIIRNPDGTTDIELIRGTQSDEYNNQELLKRSNAAIKIIVEYKIVENNKGLNLKDVGNSVITTTVKGYEEGYHQVIDMNGSVYTKGTYNQQRGYEAGYNVWSHVEGDDGYDYDLWFDADTKMDTRLIEEKNYGEISMYTNTSIDVDATTEASRVKANQEQNKLKITNYNKDNINVTSNKTSKLSYKDGETEQNVNLENFNMGVKSIQVDFDTEDTRLEAKKKNISEEETRRVEEVRFYKKGDVVGVDQPFFIATTQNPNYYFTSGEQITQYYAILGDIIRDTGYFDVDSGTYTGYTTVATWKTEWGININNLQTIMTEEQINNIKSMTRYQGGTYTLSGTELSPICKDVGTSYIESNEDKKWSYMEMDIGSYNVEKISQTQNKTVNLLMYSSERGTNSDNFVIKNENPIFYVKLSDIFSYSDFIVSCPNNPYIYIDSYGVENGYLVIRCKGIYDTSIYKEKLNISINFYRILKDPQISGTQKFEAYMVTDNGNYFMQSSNIDNLKSSSGATPSKVYYQKQNYTIEHSDKIQAISRIKRGPFAFTPDSSNTVAELTEKTMPLVTSSNRTISYISNIESANKELNNINAIYKLPVTGNMSVKISDTSDTYKLVEDQVIGLTGLANVKVYKIVNNVKVELKPSDYSIGYSTDINAGFDSVYTPYTDGIANGIAALQIKTNKMESNTYLSIEYDMVMPEEGNGLAGAMMAVKYTIQGDNTETVLDSEATYVTRGEDTATIQVQKIIEGYSRKKAPLGVSLSGVQFKIKDENGKYLKDALNQDIVVTTDNNGLATFTNIDQGIYSIEEVNSISGYKMKAKELYVIVNAPGVIGIDAVNSPLPGNLHIQKEWDDTNDQQYPVTFRVNRVNGDSINYAVSVTTDENGLAHVYGLPYGKYQIQEFSGNRGWISQQQEVIVNEEDEYVTVTNTLARGEIVIRKTVPAGETVEGLKFDVTGLGMVEYTNKSGDLVNTNTNHSITIGLDYSVIPDIDVEISEDQLDATITLYNLPMGSYTITEVDIPQIDGKDIDKYIPVKRVVNLQNNGEVKNISIQNRRKQGYLEIRKSAYLQNGEERLEIGDLGGFKVKVTGTSDYGTQIDRTITLNENGYSKTALEIGQYTLTEVDEDGYDAYYNVNGNLVSSQTGITIEIKYNETINSAETTTQEITNVHTGTGYVKVVKSLEGITDPQKVIDAAIKFKVVGKNVAGGQVEEIIDINQIDIENDVAYGISGPISVGGDYELEEIRTTVPEYFEGIDSVKVELTTDNTLENPLIINAENKKTKGNLEISTITVPEGGPLTGIIYKVTEVEIKNDGTYQTIGEPQNVNGSYIPGQEGTVNLREINAGNYLVEQVEVPYGWTKDVPQIVEVPSYSTGVAIFEITKQKEIINTQVTISKQILNRNNEIATSQDFEKAKLNEDESFEVKLTNVDTKQEYYTFISSAKNGVIKGLEPGTYKIEEQYKIKYIKEGYYILTEQLEETGNSGEPGETEEIETVIDSTDGKYTITVGEQGTPESNVNVRIKNKINTEFKFGGTDLKDNLSKIDVEQDDITFTTKSIIYIVNEQGERIPGAQFKILDSNGKEVPLGKNGNTFTTNEKRLLVKGLEPGEYTLINISVPSGYLQPKDKHFTVYQDAVRVARVEIQENIPRGSLQLATTYTTDSGDTRYTSRSKYKVVNSETGELVKFEKTNTGDYIASNLETALDEISLKSGAVKVEGIKTGNYQIGLTDVSDGFGLISTDPTNINITENTEQTVNTQVTRVAIKQIGAGSENVFYLDYNGDMWGRGRNEYGEMAGQPETQPHRIKLPNNTKISKFANGQYHIVAIDTQGKVWTWGRKSYADLGGGTGLPTCLSELEGNPLKEAYDNGIRMVDVSAGRAYSLLLDNEGKVWGFGSNVGATSPTCISDIEANGLTNIKIKNLGQQNNDVDDVYIVDIDGKVWYYTYYNWVCESEKTNNDLVGVYIEKLSHSSDNYLALDSDGQVYKDGKKISREFFDGLDIIDIVECDGANIVLDEEGKVWTWGLNYDGQLGNGSNSNVETPQCISKQPDSPIHNVKGKQLTAGMSYKNIVMLDDENKLWGWGDTNYYCQIGDYSNSYVTSPRLIEAVYANNLEYNLKFKKIDAWDGILAISENGEVWIFAVNKYYIMNRITPTRKPIKIDLPNKAKAVDISVSINGGPSIVLDEYNNIWEFGDYAGLSVGEDRSNYSIINITDKFPDKIIKIRNCGHKTIVALDEKGRVWTSGENFRGILGDGTLISNYGPTCISDNVDESLYNVKIVDITCNYNYIIALDENGKIWKWGNNQTIPVCLTDIEDSKLYNAYEDGIIIKKIINGRENISLIDDSGNYWEIGTDGEYNNTNKKEYEKYKEISELNDINIVQTIDSYVLDDQGRIWYANIANQMAWCYAEDSKNPIYNNAIDSIVPDTTLRSREYLIDKSGRIYNSAYDYIMDSEKVLELQGIELKKETMSKYISSNAGDSKIVVLDINGRLWYWGGLDESGKYIKHPVCINSDETSELHNIEITDLKYNDGRYIIATDDQGKIWSIKIDPYKRPVIQCLNKDSNSALYNKTIDKIYEQFGDDKRIIDNNGKVYVWGKNYYGTLGCGTEERVENPICLNDLPGNPFNTELNNDSTFKIIDIIIGYSATYFKDNKGRLWVCGRNWGSEPQMILEGKVIKQIIGEIVLTEDGKIYSIDSGTCSLISESIPYAEKIAAFNSTFVAYCEDSVWGWGYNQDSQLGVVTPSPYNQSPIRLITSKAKDIAYQSSGEYYKMTIIDTNNNLWVNTRQGFECLTYKASDPMYNVKVSEFVNVKKSSEVIYVKDTNNNIWYVIPSYSKKVQDSYIGNIAQNVYGDKSEQSIQNIISALNTDNYNSYVENNGRVWKLRVYIADVSATEFTILNEIKQTCNIVQYSEYFAIDENGKLYTLYSDINDRCITDIPILSSAIIGKGWTIATKLY